MKKSVKREKEREREREREREKRRGEREKERGGERERERRERRERNRDLDFWAHLIVHPYLTYPSGVSAPLMHSLPEIKPHQWTTVVCCHNPVFNTDITFNENVLSVSSNQIK